MARRAGRSDSPENHERSAYPLTSRNTSTITPQVSVVEGRESTEGEARRAPRTPASAAYGIGGHGKGRPVPVRGRPWDVGRVAQEAEAGQGTCGEW